jgi:hypothetical protein
VDFLCLNQADESDIRAAIPHMAAWYRMAAQCHAYPLGFDLDVSMKMYSPRWLHGQVNEEYLQFALDLSFVST